MNHAIPGVVRNIGGKVVETVSLRDIYDFIDPSPPFHDWASRVMGVARLAEGKDYLKATVKTAGRPRTEYYLTISAGKKVSTAALSAKGQVVREALNERPIKGRREKREEAKAKVQKVPKTLHEALRLAADLSEKNQELIKKIEESQFMNQFARLIVEQVQVAFPSRLEL